MCSRRETTLASETLLAGQAQALTQKAIDIALTGDIPALRICLDRILPPRKDRPVTFALPPIESAQNAAATVSAVLAAVAAGDLTPADAGTVVTWGLPSARQSSLRAIALSFWSGSVMARCRRPDG